MLTQVTALALASFPHTITPKPLISEMSTLAGQAGLSLPLVEAGYRRALLDKLVEEAGEAARASAADLPRELADVLEVLRALTAAAGISWHEFLSLADDKRNHRGGFAGKIFLESVE